MNSTENIFQPEPDHVPDSTEAKIFEAAHKIFVKKGMDGTKMQEIADEAGINKALLHYYYRSKEKLYEMVARGVIRVAMPRLRAILEGDLPLEEKLDNLVEKYIDLLRANPFMPLFLVNELNRHPENFQKLILPKELPRPDAFFKQVEQAVAEGKIRPIDPRHLVANVLAMCIFPVLAKPILQLFLGMDERVYKKFMDERKAEVKAFIFHSLKPD